MGLSVANKIVKSDVGRQRDHNEDSAIEVEPMFMLADGMGGAQAGEVASQTAAQVFSDGAGKDGTPEERLTRLAKKANSQIYELAQADEAKRGMGTTLTVALVEGDGVTVAHVGDSRVYRMRDGELEQLTHDHSLVAELERSGEISHEEAFDHPSKSVITRALGPEPDVDVDAHTHSGRPGDTYLMSSDGLTDMITDDEIAAILRGSDSLDETAESLIRAANQSGGRDNITVVLFTLEAGEDDPDEVAEDTIVRGLSATDVHEAVEEQEKAGRAATVPRERPQPTKPMTVQPAKSGLPEAGARTARRPARNRGDRRGGRARRAPGLLRRHQRCRAGHALPGRSVRAPPRLGALLRALLQQRARAHDREEPAGARARSRVAQPRRRRGPGAPARAGDARPRVSPR